MNAPSRNANYCLQFLRNGGERVRAIVLCRELTEMTLVEAVNYVDKLSTPVSLDANRV